MYQFSVVLLELRKWFESFRWYQLLQPFALRLLFGGLGVMFLYEILFGMLSFGSYSALSMIFYTIPLYSIANHVFLLSAWVTLASKEVKYLPYALWIKAFIMMFPFSDISLSGLIPVAVYAFLGYILFKYSATEYAVK